MPRAEQSSMEKATLGELEVSESHACDDHKSPELVVAEEAPVYRLYKRRFLGVVGLVRLYTPLTMILRLTSCLFSSY
jgi:hypothetical protein